MSKIMRLGIMGILMSVCMLFFAGCGTSDKFEGKWATKIYENKFGPVADPTVYVLEIKKNGNKDYSVQWYNVHFSEKTNDVVDNDRIELTAQKTDGENSIRIQQGIQPFIAFNEEKKCLQCALGSGMKDYKRVESDKDYQTIKDEVKEKYEEMVNKKK